MELSELRTKIIESFAGSADDLDEVLQMVDDDQSIFPFNEYEHLICNLIEKGGLTYEQYIDIRTEYISANPNLWVFEISAPRGFGEKFAQTYVQGKCSKLKSPTKLQSETKSAAYNKWCAKVGDAERKWGWK